MANLEIKRNKLNEILDLYTSKESRDVIHSGLMLKRDLYGWEPKNNISM
jgi:hypothetical protein